MKIYKSYAEIEEVLYAKVRNMVEDECTEDFGLYIVEANENYIDTVYFGLRDLFFNYNWLIIGNDICNGEAEFDMKRIKVVNPIHILDDDCKEEVQEIIKKFVLEYGLVDESRNCYTFDEPF